MCSPIGHTIIGYSIANIICKDNIKNRKLLFTIPVLSILPDLDFIYIFISKNIYSHRTFSHSIFFAILVSFIIFIFKDKFYKGISNISLLAFFIILSHIIADMLMPPGIIPIPIRPFYPFTLQVHMPFFLFMNIHWFSLDSIFSLNNLIAIIWETFVTSLFFILILFFINLKSNINNNNLVKK